MFVWFIMIRKFADKSKNKTSTYEKNNLDQVKSMGRNIFEDDENKFKIFFIETNASQNYIQPRALCSIESAAKNNPNAIINVKSLNARIKDEKIFFENYPNVRFELFDPIDVFKNTPLEKWWIEKRVEKQKDQYYRMAHTADALRLAFIYTHGGLYSDLDRMTVKSYKPLMNYSGFFNVVDEDKGITNSILIASQNHPFLQYLMTKFAENYDPL
jgi:lactosylceramide 4-alpha-galactosyltransferase